MTNNDSRGRNYQWKHSFVILILILLSSMEFYSQDLAYIYGKVIDSKTQVPLAFASIVEKDKTVGLITNDDGGFKIPSYYYTADVTIVVSFMGYYSQEIPVRNLKRNDLNLIKLTQKTEFLDEIVIGKQKELSATEIVKLAIRKIKVNYPIEEFSYIGYYRDYQKDQKNAYLNLNEAILQVYDPGFNKDDFEFTKTSIFRYESNLDFPRDSIASKLYDYTEKTKYNKNAVLNDLGEKGNEFALLRFHDAIRNYNLDTYDYVNTLQSDFIQNHQFELIKNTSLDDINLYEIKFWKELDQVLAEGKIFISKVDFKIYKLDYSVFKMEKIKDDSKSAHYMRTVRKKRKKEELIYNVIVEYNDHQDIMFPKYISFNNPFQVIKPPKFYPTKAFFRHTREIEQPLIISIDLHFNNQISPKGVENKKNYKLSYKGNNIKIDKIVFRKNKPIITIFPNELDILFYAEAFEQGQKIPTEDFIIDVKNIQDTKGNIVLEKEAVTYNQYREFFLQELISDWKKPNHSLFMIKTQPIFQDQPILNLNNMSRYWMNTPMKNKR